MIDHMGKIVVPPALSAIFLLLFQPALCAAPPEVLPGTGRLEERADFRTLILHQWGDFLLKEAETAKTERSRFWQRDYSDPAAYAKSMAVNREHLRSCIGAVDERISAMPLEMVVRLGETGLRAETAIYSVYAVRWPVFPGVHAEGLLLKPKRKPLGGVIAIPDADQTPEMLVGLNPGVASASRFAAHLAEQGFMVLVPTLIDRRSIWSGDERLGIPTDHSHREWIYRQAGEVGRHPIGYEVQKIQAGIDWLLSADGLAADGGRKIGVAGYGEGGLLALYTAALDERVDAAWVSGYFQAREELWREPLYRNLWGLLTEFGDAELAAMIAPRGLVVEYSRSPEVTHPLRPDRSGTPVREVSGVGKITTPNPSAVVPEWERAKQLAGPFSRQFTLVGGEHGRPVEFGSAAASEAFGRLLGLRDMAARHEAFTTCVPLSAAEQDARQYRQIRELQEFSQERLRLAEYEREKFFWDRLTPRVPGKYFWTKVTPAGPEAWSQAIKPLRDYFWDEVIGRFPDPANPLNAHSRRLPEHSDPRVTTYEVTLDALPGVYTWGYLLLPTDLKPGERRPVVVCQHGAGGQPASTLEASGIYRAFARKLAERGFIVYAPYNPDKGWGQAFRELQRKGHPLKKTIYGIYAKNHQRVLQWLKQQSFVDGERIAFYGISYGGKTAVRVPALLEDYCLSICSGDWNDYVKKVTSLRFDKNSLMFYDSPESVQFNMGNRFNYAEMAALIAPRPFMVEHGYEDTVAPLEWAAAEYAKVQKLYLYLGISERTEMAFFDGPHMIHGEKTFPFLHRHLRWPEPAP